MIAQRAFKVELRLNNKERTLCNRYAGAARFAYNWGLRKKIDAYEAGKKYSTAMDLHKELVRLKHEGELGWLSEISSRPPQEALRDLDRAYSRFFDYIKKAKAGIPARRIGFPRFKSRRSRKSFRMVGKIAVSEHGIKVSRLPFLRFKEQGYVPASCDGVRATSATFSECAGRWYVSVLVKMDVPEPTRATGDAIGIDLGTKERAIVSDGRKYGNPRLLAGMMKKKRRLQRELSRRTKGGKNWKKTKGKLQKLEARIARIRNDSIHKVTGNIVGVGQPDEERPQMIALEDLNVQGMMSKGGAYKRGLNRSLGDIAMGEFRRQVTYKAEHAGVDVVMVDRWFPSSKMCSECGCVKDTLGLDERVYRCDACGLEIDRDLNAAINLLKWAEMHGTVSATET